MTPGLPQTSVDPLLSAERSARIETESRIDVWHNLLWARYKGHIFTGVFNLSHARNVSVRFYQIARSMGARASMGTIDLRDHDYPLHLLFDNDFDSTTFHSRLLRILSISIRSDADIAVLAGYDRPEYFLQCVVYRLKGVRVMVFCDSTIHDQKQIWWKSIVKYSFFSMCYGALCYGQRSRDYVMRYGIRADRAFGGCQAAALQAECDNDHVRTVRRSRYHSGAPLIFLYVGRLAAEKRVDTLIYAFAAARRTLSNTRLRIVGAGPEAAHLKRLNLALGVADSVDFCGPLSGDALARAYLNASCLVLPSASEPWGLVVNEALAYGCPAIVSDCCGCGPELIVTGRTGFVFRAGDSLDLARKLIRAAECLSPRERVTEDCLAQVARYTPAQAARHIFNAMASASASPNS